MNTADQCVVIAAFCVICAIAILTLLPPPLPIALSALVSLAAVVIWYLS